MKKALSIVLCIALLFAIVLVNYTVIYAQTGDKFVFEAENCYDKDNTVSKVSTSSNYTGWNSDCSATQTGQTFLIHDPSCAAVGDYITFNLSGLEQGSYELYFGYRINGNRCTYKIEAWDSSNVVQSAGDSVNFMAKSGTNVTYYASYFTSVKTSKEISVAAGDSLTLKMTIESLPTNSSHGFYIDKILLVKASDDIGTTASGATTAPTITMDNGAAMRIDSKTEGIRFSATVNKTELDGFGYKVTDAGMLVAKKEQASESTLTVENSEPVTSSGVSIGVGKVVAARYNGATLKTADDANKYVIFGSLVEISEKNANQKYVARAFIEYTDGEGNTAYLYSDLSDARSIAEVASLIRQDGLAKPGDDTVYYNTLCGTHKDVVDFWAGKYSN